jgi:hypothetical protein
MSTNTYSPHSNTLNIVKSLRDGEIQASVESLRKRDKLTQGLRSSLKAGIPMSDLVEATGLSPTEIRQRVESPLHIDE